MKINNKLKTNNKLKINSKLIITSAVLLAFGALTACQTKTQTKNGAANQPVVQAADITKLPENINMKNNKPDDFLSSPTEAYKAAYTARKNKDLDGLKRVMSKRAIKVLTRIGEMDHKTLDDALEEVIAQPQAATAEVRDEHITGNTATLEYLDEDGRWKPMDFVKEDGDWKLTPPATPSMDEEDAADDEDTTKKE